MTIIVDTNIIISACLDSNGTLFKIITTPLKHIDFVSPDLALEEIIQHQVQICLKTKKSIVLFYDNLSVLVKYLHIFSSDGLSTTTILEAEILAAQIDIDDTIFVAFSIELDALLWTGDLKLFKALRRNGFNKIIITKELKNILKGL